MDVEQREVSTTVRAAAAALLVGLGMGVVAILVWADVNEPESTASLTDQPSLVGAETPTANPDSSARGPERTTSTTERCASAAEALEDPLEAAEPALEQWGVHIEAMNQLVVGEITLQQATDFWNRTRLGAQRRIDQFNTSWMALRRQGVDCPSPLLLAAADPVPRPCVRKVAAKIQVLEAAHTSLRMWGQHVEHMDMLRLGTLSPEDATAMWLTMWRQGDRELHTYLAAAREERRLDGCTATTSTE